MKNKLFEHVGGNKFVLQKNNIREIQINEIDFSNSDPKYSERFVGKFFILVDGEPYGAPNQIRPFATQEDAEVYASLIIKNSKIDPKRIEIVPMR